MENLDDLDPSEKKRILDEVKSILGVAVQDETITEGLRRAARDINLGRALRERGIMRLYRILEADYRTEDGVALPAYTFLTNPDTGERFSNKEDLIRWFCTHAGVSRAWVFNRIKVIDRLMVLGFSAEEIYGFMIEKPHAVGESLKVLAEWGEDDEIEAIPSQVILALADRYNKEDIKNQIYLPDAERSKDVIQEVTPLLKEAVREGVSLPNAHDTIAFAKYDLAMKPEISAVWNEDEDCLEVRMYSKRPYEGGLISDILNIKFIPDYPSAVPDEVKDFLCRKLGIKRSKN